MSNLRKNSPTHQPLVNKKNVSGQYHESDIVFNVIIESNVQKIICKKYSDIYN